MEDGSSASAQQNPVGVGDGASNLGNFPALVDGATEVGDVVSMIQRSSAPQQALLLSELVKQVRQCSTAVKFHQLIAAYSVSPKGATRSKVCEALVNSAVELFVASSVSLYVVSDASTGQLRLEISKDAEGVEFDRSNTVLLKKCLGSAKTCAGRSTPTSDQSPVELCVPIIFDGVRAVMRIVRLTTKGSGDQDIIFHGPDRQILESLANQIAPFFKDDASLSRGVDPATIVAQPPMGETSAEDPSQLLKLWSYDVWDFESAAVQRHIFAMYDLLGLIEAFSINRAKLHGFISLVVSGYRDVPFHNWRHGACVGQVAYFFLSSEGVGKSIDSIHHLALLTAAICHDLDHPGTNNAFQVNSSSGLALRYNDVSVLENHHSATAWKILRTNGADILTSLDKAQFKLCRSLIISSILMTDMGSHFSLMDNFREVIGKDGAVTVLNIPEGKEEQTKKLITNALLHCADLSNPTRPWKMAEKWGRLVGEEFEAQVTSETDLGIPISAFMHAESEEKRIRNEIGFIKGLIAPWWSTAADAFPDLSFAKDLIAENIANYEAAAAAAAAAAEGV